MTLFASMAAIVSVLKVAASSYAWRHGMERNPMPPDVHRWFARAGTTPVCLFLLSFPVAFVSTPLAVAVWILAMPVGAVLDRRRPPGAERWLP